MNPSKSSYFVAFLTSMVAFVMLWVCFYIFLQSRHVGDVGMTGVYLFLVVTPVVMIVGGIVGIVLLRHFYRTSYFEALKISAVFVWLVLVSGIAGRAAVSTVLERLGDMFPQKGPDVTVVNVAPPQ
jgi:hypothetical protein